MPPPICPAPATRTCWNSTAREATVRPMPRAANGLWYDRTGSGDPVVLIHEGVVDSRSWAPVVPALAERFEVVTYDQRAYGRSDGWHGPYSLVDDLVGVLDELGIARAGTRRGVPRRPDRARHGADAAGPGDEARARRLGARRPSAQCRGDAGAGGALGCGRGRRRPGDAGGDRPRGLGAARRGRGAPAAVPRERRGVERRRPGGAGRAAGGDAPGGDPASPRSS